MRPTHPFTAEVLGDLIHVHRSSVVAGTRIGQNGEPLDRLRKTIEQVFRPGTNEILAAAAMEDLGWMYSRSGKTNEGREILERIPRTGILDWLILAPIPLEAEKSGALALALEASQLPGESAIRPRDHEGVSFGERELTWLPHKGSFVLDFEWMLENRVENALAYAVSYLVSPEAQRGLVMSIDSDDLAKVYLNGKEVYKALQAGSFGYSPGKVENLELAGGVNTLVVKVVNGLGAWKCAVALSHSDGTPVKGLKLTLDPTGN